MGKIWIDKGEHDWRPADIPVPILRCCFKELVFEVEFDKSCWYRWLQDDGKVDKDQFDVNKGGGLTNMLSFNDVDSFMWGWWPDPEIKHKFNVTAYSNIGKDKVEIGNADGKVVLPVYASERFWVTIKPGPGRGWQMKIETKERIGMAFHVHRSKFRVMRTLGSWFGGKNNEPGPWGGVAPHDMKMFVSRKIKLF